MSNETALDWLARNVHVWPEGKREVLACCPRNVDTLIWSCVLSNSGWITKDQWLARRAELQNKPSWNGAPEWANWLAQDEEIDVKGVGGGWFWYERCPTPRAAWDADGGLTVFSGAHGAVLGDWRDTLEKRPEDFQPLTSIEDNQEQDMAKQQEMKRDNGWFERGELPPVGLMCEIRLSCWNSEKYEKVTVAAITKEYLIVKYATFEQHYMLKDISFRPLRTERDKLVELIKTYRHTFRSDTEFADAILAAGFRRGGAA